MKNSSASCLTDINTDFNADTAFNADFYTDFNADTDLRRVLNTDFNSYINNSLYSILVVFVYHYTIT